MTTINPLLLTQQNNELMLKCQQYEAICKKYESTIADLYNKIGILEKQMQPSTSFLNRSANPHSITNDNYHTDEEELEKEFTEVQHNKNKKKRKLNNTLSPKNQPDVENQPEVKNQPEAKIQKEPLPPPINVSNVRDFNVLRSRILTVAETPVQFKAISNNDIKITTQNDNDYRKIKKYLSNLKDDESGPLCNIEYHTYQLKSDRWYRIVIRGLPSSTEREDIKTAIEEKGHKVENIINVLKKSTVNGEKIIKNFPLFYVDILQKENNKEIFEIKDLLHCKVTIEPPNKVRGIPQCTNCQQLGHTKNFCNRQTKCVKCAGNHHTKECKKSRNIIPTCALCGQKGHPANYKGCETYQKRLKAQQQKKVTVVQRLQQKVDKQNEPAKHITTGVSYAQAVKTLNGKQNQEIKQNIATTEPTISDMMKMLCEFQTEMRQNFSQLANRVEKLENKARPPNKKAKQK